MAAEHAPSMRPHAVTAITRLMIPISAATGRLSPHNTTLAEGPSRVQPENLPSNALVSAPRCPKCGGHKVKSGLTLFCREGSAHLQEVEYGAG